MPPIRFTITGEDVAPGSREAQRFRSVASWIGRVMLLLSLVILALAIQLVRGG